MKNILRTLKENLTVFFLQLESHLTTYRGEAMNRACMTRKKPMTYTPQHIANYFLERAEEDGIPMSPLKLIKLVYIAYGWYIALTGKRLFDEEIEAWQHGPVIPSLYHEFKHFKSKSIDDWAEHFDMDTFEASIPRIDTSDKETSLILSKVWAAYSRFAAWALRDKTHERNGPWHKVYKKGVRGIEMRDKDISDHYAVKIREYLNAAEATQA